MDTQKASEGHVKKNQQTIQISFHVLLGCIKKKKQQSLGKALEMRLLILFFGHFPEAKVIFRFVGY